MSASIAATVIRTVSGWYVKNIDAEKTDIGRMRNRWNVAARCLIPAFGVQFETTTIAGIAAEWLTPEEPTPGKVLLYLHGGAYVMGGCTTHRQLVSHLARAGKIRALVADYRLAPEHKFPAALDDAMAVYRALLADGIAAHDIVVAGDSAGGGLTVAMLMALRDSGDPLPAAAVLLSPFLDVTGSGESVKTRAEVEPWFRPENIRIVAEHYCGAEQQRDPLVSPVFGTAAGLPPMLIQVGDREILLSDSQRFAEMLRAEGIPVELQVWPEMWHVFQVCVRKMPESWRAIQRIGEYIRGQSVSENHRTSSS